MLWRLLCLTLACNLQVIKNEAAYMNYPMRSDFAECELVTEEKEQFLDLHNKLRGMVNPTAADMEYLVWDENLANLAQMWVNKCIWEHGFLFFGKEYPKEKNAKFTKQLGQNLAREVGHLKTPEDRVMRWFNESYYYTYSKYTSTGGNCRRQPCGHYTQLAWANVKYVGCAKTFCSNFFPQYGGGTYVACDYGPESGNVYKQYPYQQGIPCSKCASGNGFCHKNLCRDCVDYDSRCGSNFPQSTCLSHPELMAKMCPKMCKLCECPLQCRNGGSLNKEKCVCSCRPGWTSTDCSDPCYDKDGKQRCQQNVKYNGGCNSVQWASYFKENCEATCGYCDDGSGTYTTTASPVAMTTPSPPVTTPAAALIVTTDTTLPPPTTARPQVICTADLDRSCPGWAATGWCEKNKDWMLIYCCISCKYHQAPECKDSQKDCPFWAYKGYCYSNRVWMLANCRRSCNQCGGCKDTDPKCPSWAVLKQCYSGNRVAWMNTNCRKSCGLCRGETWMISSKIYDKHAECPAWGVMGNCRASNWTWMTDHCPESCDVPLTQVLLCGGKPDGNYQSPSSCNAYIACSHEATSHVDCPLAEKFDRKTRICKPANEASCQMADLSDESHYKLVATLKNGKN
ncbi:uncharacterized protein [Acropora muricata]|uniref:uncharacterized protein n=1 Tax=Acropora muricata TaxID=159855 RepID=UPI0034E4991E